ncbi:TetR/AcrR family transcriptional regulator C-terminal domain-containing protein [Leptospira levettii]|uniref:TetR/AcrR family transcriptional regulator C-terminal domain-containing protein n=1 Tax=Leptospira levettii TaxID=2023178 RepID=A0AAW5VEF4_9LEPT|nr:MULTISPECIES: TetR/AcrR family transcriptional regulator C-terminal domain-containing protein [Leptospira]MBL0953179.1 TetR/AcrR family transcriptional regulator [Leptospira sp.]MCW7467184.1 TetR/AcrR family transcriptional regulator C-terminal domain-containing protein [Leptospira levettii]MCW7497699.1 TetR/AcrR family transcriptional regulator C-terminal domain-containing protein [Leptospira levettii]MCW7512906.1 TetR/AcrR family transcriptional regulator C-terminal domain-containing prote
MAFQKKIQKPKKSLSKEILIEASISFADKKGINSLSMRNLANLLGVEAMSLYNHIQNKDELLDGMVEDCVKKIAYPKIGGYWRKEMKKRAKSVRKILLLHPWLTMLLVSRVNVGENLLQYFNDTLGCLVKAGFSYKQADQMINAIDAHIYGFTLQELNFPFKTEEYSQKASEYLPMIPKDQLPYFYQLTKDVATKKYNGKHDFEFGLDLILDGFNPNPKS